MNIQIFGKVKCFDTKKAERYFKERRIKFQAIDLKKYGMSGKEFDSVLRAVGGYTLCCTDSGSFTLSCLQILSLTVLICSFHTSLLFLSVYKL